MMGVGGTQSIWLSYSHTVTLPDKGHPLNNEGKNTASPPALPKAAGSIRNSLGRRVGREFPEVGAGENHTVYGEARAGAHGALSACVSCSGAQPQGAATEKHSVTR